MNALRALCRATCHPALVAAAIAASAVGTVSHAVAVTNLSSNTPVFAGNLKKFKPLPLHLSQAVACSDERSRRQLSPSRVKVLHFQLEAT
ncbi:MAG TPA: hypothetical protein PK306_11895 [Aquabacterium sp.]|nr:hypothetical protein [Aquabacterium sp.]